MDKKKVRLADMLPMMEETLQSGGTVKLPITGTSMLPLLVAGRDTVVLRAADGALQKYDLPLYRRQDGAFVLHRVVGTAADGSYTMCGDNQWVKECGIRDAQIIGVVETVIRNGKALSVSSMQYRVYVRIWHLLFPVRKYIVKVRGKLKK